VPEGPDSPGATAAAWVDPSGIPIVPCRSVAASSPSRPTRARGFSYPAGRGFLPGKPDLWVRPAREPTPCPPAPCHPAEGLARAEQWNNPARRTRKRVLCSGSSGPCTGCSGSEGSRRSAHVGERCKLEGSSPRLNRLPTAIASRHRSRGCVSGSTVYAPPTTSSVGRNSRVSLYGYRLRMSTRAKGSSRIRLLLMPGVSR